MENSLHKLERRTKLAVRWVRHILFAPNHFHVNPLTSLRFKLKGYVPDQYVIYDFAHTDYHEYLSEFDWYRSRWINDPFSDQFNNKIMCADALRGYVRVPDSLIMKQNGVMINLESGQANRYAAPSEVMEAINRYGAVFLKPFNTGKGNGVHRLSVSVPAYLIDDEPASEDDILRFIGQRDDWFISEAIGQHPFLDEIYAPTINTMRIITLRDPKTGAYKVFFAVLRIGTAQTIPVDNGSRGGLVANIDLETGLLSCAKSLQRLGSWDVHPDSGGQIKGRRIPGWPEIMAQMEQLAQRFPYASFVAWDILLTPEGICVIEANTSSGVNIIQLWGPQKNGELGAFYRAHGVIK